MAETSVTTRTDPLTTPGLRVAAAAGVLLVAYSYLAALWPSRHSSTPRPVTIIRAWVNRPTGLGEDFGHLGTVLLLLVAGFAITGAVCTGRRARLARAGLIPLGIAVALGALVRVVGGGVLTDVAVVAPVVAAGCFAVSTSALLPLLHRHPVPAVFVPLAVACVVALLAGSAAGSEAARVAGSAAAFVPMLVVGQVSWMVRTGRLPNAVGVVFGLVCLGATVGADVVFPEYSAFWRPLGGVVASVLFLIALPRSGSFAATGPVRWLADRAWPLVLAVPVIGFPALDLLSGLPFVLGLPVAAAAVGVGGEALHRVVGWAA
ncbi:MAG: hypothetical protein HOY78_43590 [Saccharothrix sp.]|nr:hypothetical protein [Saccharothrix sp.]